MDLSCHLNFRRHGPTLKPKRSNVLLIKQQTFNQKEVDAWVVQAAQIRNAEEGRLLGRKNRNLRWLEQGRAGNHGEASVHAIGGHNHWRAWVCGEVPQNRLEAQENRPSRGTLRRT